MKNSHPHLKLKDGGKIETPTGKIRRLLITHGDITEVIDTPDDADSIIANIRKGLRRIQEAIVRG